MKAKRVALLGIFALLLAFSMAVLYAELGSVSIENNHRCIESTVVWTEIEPVYQFVALEQPTYGLIWSEANQTYEFGANGTEQYQTLQQRGETSIQRSKQICERDISHLNIDIEFSSIRINYGEQGFSCSNTEDTIICDSKKDGNGDGICQSGESCATFEVLANYVKLTYTNGNTQLTCMKTSKQGVPFEICTDATINIRDFLEVR